MYDELPCEWCYDDATHVAWSPRHGWHPLCDRHHDELSRSLVANLTGA